MNPNNPADRHNGPSLASWIIFAALLATAVVYSVGLDGPYLFDDAFNLDPVRLWARGRLGWHEVVFGNVSGVLGRPVSMASFLLSAALGNATPLDFKLGNLLVHAICAVLIYKLLRRLLAETAATAQFQAPAAALLTTLWVLHPLHVSTVLYAVQRMAQLSTLFVLACLLAYLTGRKALAQNHRDQALRWLFLAFPLLWMLGLLSKENAAVAPVLCLLLEVAYFQREGSTRRTVSAFLALMLGLPAAAAVVVLALKPHVLFVGYAIRDFTMGERLLTQSRALIDYLGMLVYPRGERMGVFTDDFVLSTGLFSPPTTALALLALLAVSAAAIALRRRSPHLFAGWFFFLIAHAVESSVLPLELYYEHRNYLPSVGLLLMIAGLLSLLPATTRSKTSYSKAVVFAAALGALILGAITFQQAQVWSSKDRIIDQAVRNHPQSLRAVQAKFVAAINRGRYDEAMAWLAPMQHSGNPRVRLLTHLDMISTACLRGSGIDSSWLTKATRDARQRLTVAEMQSVGMLMQVSRDGRCKGLEETRIADAIVQLIDAATLQSDDILPKWQLRYAAAVIYARNGSWPQALVQIQRARQPGAGAEIDGLLIQSLAHNGRQDEARRLLNELARRVGPQDHQAQTVLDAARKAVTAQSSF